MPSIEQQKTSVTEEQLSQQVAELEKAGDIVGAIDRLKELIELDPENSDYLNQLGEHLENSGDQQGAEIAFDRARVVDLAQLEDMNFRFR